MQGTGAGEDSSSVFETIPRVKIKGIGSHRGFLGIDNRDFMLKTRLSDFRVEHEAHELAKNCFLSALVQDAGQELMVKYVCQTLKENHSRFWFLMHPES